MKALKVLRYCAFAMAILMAILANADPTPDEVESAVNRHDPNQKHPNVHGVLALDLKKGLDKLKNMPSIKKGIEKLKQLPEMLKKFTKKHSQKKKKKRDRDNDQEPPLAPAFVPNPSKPKILAV